MGATRYSAVVAQSWSPEGGPTCTPHPSRITCGNTDGNTERADHHDHHSDSARAAQASPQGSRATFAVTAGFIAPANAAELDETISNLVVSRTDNVTVGETLRITASAQSGHLCRGIIR